MRLPTPCYAIETDMAAAYPAAFGHYGRGPDVQRKLDIINTVYGASRQHRGQDDYRPA